jgi:hypothetical protein
MITLQGRIYVQRTLLFSVALVRLQEAAEQSSVLSHQSVKEERGGAMSRFKEYEEKHRGYADRSGSTLRPDSIVLKSKSIFAANSDKTWREKSIVFHQQKFFIIHRIYGIVPNNLLLIN